MLFAAGRLCRDFFRRQLMQMCRRVLGAVVAVTLFAPAAFAQQTHVINQSALDQAVQQRVSQDQADREAIRTFLQNPTVKQVAAKAGLSTDKAEAAVSTLQGDELRQAASQARTVNDQLAGGSTIVISTTTIIIVLLVIILLVALGGRGSRRAGGAGSSPGPSRSARRPPLRRRPRRSRSPFRISRKQRICVAAPRPRWSCATGA